MSMIDGMRANTWANTVTVDGVPLGVWDTLEGGEVDSEETRYRPGGMAPQVSLGGTATVGALTLGRLLSRGRDWDLLRRLMNRAGKARATVHRQPLDSDGNPWGRPMVYRGVLKTVTPPDTDSDSDDPALWQIVITPEGTVS